MFANTGPLYVRVSVRGEKVVQLLGNRPTAEPTPPVEEPHEALPQLGIQIERASAKFLPMWRIRR